MHRAGVWVILLALLSVPAAATVQGDLVLDGPLRLVGGGQLHGAPLALVANTSKVIDTFEAEFDLLRITVYTQETKTAADLVTLAGDSRLGSRSHSTFDVTSARLVLAAGNHSGMLGLYPRESPEVDVGLPLNGSLVALSNRWYGGVSFTPTSGEKPDSPFYDVEVKRPHLNVGGATSVRYVGPGAMKIRGPDVSILTAENETTYVTGIEKLRDAPDQPLVAEERETWLFLEFLSSEITITSAGDWDIALVHSDLLWPGPALLDSPTSGSLNVDGRDALKAEDGDPQPVVALDVPVAGVAVPYVVGQDVRMALSLWNPPPPPEAPGSGLLGVTSGRSPGPLDLILLLSVAAGASSLAVWTVRRRMRGSMDVDEMLTLAHMAGEGGRHDEALGWIRRARQAAPHSAALALEEAFHLGELGLVDEALAAYREAARLSGDGQAEFDAALLAERANALPDAEIEALLVGALEKNPGLVLELDEALGMRLRPIASPALEAAIRRAHGRLDRP